MATKIRYLILYLFVISAVLLSVSISEAQTPPLSWTRNRIIAESTNNNYFIHNSVLGIAIAPNGMYGIVYADNRFRLHSVYSEDLFLQIFGRDGEPVGDAINILPPPYGLGLNSPLDIELFADNEGFYVTSHTGVLVIAKVDFQGNVLYTNVHHIYWLGGASASIGPEGKINLVGVFWNSTSTVYNLAYYQFNKDTGDAVRPETPISIPGRDPTDGIWNIKLVTDPQGNNYAIYVKRRHIDRNIKLHLLKFDRNGNVLYNLEVNSQWYTTAKSVAMDYVNGKIHLAWEALNPEFPYNDVVYYGQIYAARGDPVFPSIAVTDPGARNFGAVMAVNGDKVNIAYLKSSNSIYILDLDAYYVQLNANDGSVRAPPTKFNTQYLRDVKAVAIASDEMRTHVAWITWGTLDNQSHKLIENVYLPEIVGPNYPRVGARTPYSLYAQLNRGENYAVAAAFDPNDPNDPLLQFSEYILEGRFGRLDTNGQASTTLNLPAGVPTGLRFFLFFVTYTGERITSVSTPKLITVS